MSMNYYLANKLSSRELSEEFDRLTAAMKLCAERIKSYSEYEKTSIVGKQSFDTEIKHMKDLAEQRQLIDNIWLNIDSNRIA